MVGGRWQELLTLLRLPDFFPLLFFFFFIIFLVKGKPEDDFQINITQDYFNKKIKKKTPLSRSLWGRIEVPCSDAGSALEINEKHFRL